MKKEYLRPEGPFYEYDAALFPPTTDSFALGYFARPHKGDRVCDLGGGCGLLGLLLLAREPSLQLCSMEINADAHAVAGKNFAANDFAVTCLCADLRDCSSLLPTGSMDYIVSNPPYFASGSGEAAKGTRKGQRGEETCTLAELCVAAGYLLRYGGSFAVVHRVERLAALFAAMKGTAIEPKRLRFLHTDLSQSPTLALVEGRRGGHEGLIVEPPLLIGSSEWERVYFRT